MTRKITIGCVLLLLIVLSYQMLFGTSTFFRSKVASISDLELANKELETKSAKLSKISDKDFEEQKEELSRIIKKYKSEKEEYEEIFEQYTAAEEAREQEEAAAEAAKEAARIALLQSQVKDIYDVDFLWTIIGNYATEEGIELQFDINKNSTSASSVNNVDNSYIVCDLKFTIKGSYINLTDFIYDIEDDDRLNFEINDFDMQKEGEGLLVTLNVKEVKLNSSNLIDGGTVAAQGDDSIVSEITDAINDSTQNVDATTSTSESDADSSQANSSTIEENPNGNSATSQVN